MKFFSRTWYLPLALSVAAGLCWGQQPTQYPGEQQSPGQQQQPAQAQPPAQQPGASSDTQTQTQVQSAIDANSALKAAGVTATVTNGQVTLMGVVGDNALKDEAESAAKSVAGVTSIQNLITVSPSAGQQTTQPGQAQQPGQQQPAQPGQEQQPGQQPAQPGQQPTQPGQQPPSSQPGQQAQPPAAQPGQQPTQPGQEQQPEQQPTQPGQQPAQPGQEQQPGQQPAQPGQQPTQPGQMPPSSQPGQQAQPPAAQPGQQPTQPGQEQQPGQQPAQPGQQPTQPGQMPPSSQPGQQPAQPGQEQQPTQPGQTPPSAQPGQPAQPPAQPEAGTGIQGQVNSALMNDPELGKYALTASVDPKGAVTLSGTVPNKSDKKHAKQVVEDVGGVTKVHNKIKVNSSATPMQGQPPQGQTPPAEQPPYSGQQPTTQQPPTQPSQPPATEPQQPPTSEPPNGEPLLLGPHSPLGQNGSAGAPGTAAPVQQSQSSQTNPATGQQSVDTSQQLQQQVTQALANDPELSKYGVKGVVTGNGKVTLEGVVPSKSDKKHAEVLAKGINGVRAVDDKLTVDANAKPVSTEQQPSEQPPAQQPPQTPGGGVLWSQQSSAQAAANPAMPQDEETQLQNSLKNDPALTGVNAAVSGNTVTLTGTVGSRADKKRAEDMIKKAAPKGAKIHDRIKVQKTSQGAQQPPAL